MSSGDRSKYSANVSTDSALRLAEFIEDCENEQDEISTSDENIQKIKNFLDVKFNTTSIVQIQSFCATTNDHSSLSALNVNLATLIKLANRYPQLHQSIKFLVLEIISTHNVKVFYRCLSNEHPGVANPALKLISQIVSFNNGVFVDEFLENFDLTVKSFCDLMYPTKATAKLSKNGKSFLTVRHNMVTFWINLCSNASPLTRMDLLSNNKKINSGWIKYITEFDNNSLIKRTLQFFETKVLNEPSFRKMTKCKLLGDFTIGKFVELYKISDIKDEIHKLLLKITTDEENGLLFHDYRTYFQNVPLACLPSNANFNNNDYLQYSYLIKTLVRHVASEIADFHIRACS
ncbi:Nucleolar pre-ribosomal-associated protein 1 [Pichia kudriavzevii]|uniref:Nucleolar pre-ribosomal-associated protein 1 n=1 Tax=Pichia kudriavzevii TaxID=4909 RepID=A0A1V2LIU8_PICKU|nr:Nucleolar pre-ribosomal-associated protein 1 [Pichia kudriavzevii]